MEFLFIESKKPLGVLESLWMLPEVLVLKEYPEETGSCVRMGCGAEVWGVVFPGLTVGREQWNTRRAANSNNSDVRLLAIYTKVLFMAINITALTDLQSKTTAVYEK